MSTTAWLFFLPACFAINLAPGPNNLLSINVAARHGFATAFLGGTGRLVAFAGMIVLAATGLAVVLHASEWFFLAIKLAGAAYLIWLAIQLWRSDAPAIDITRDESASLAKVARQEFLVAAGNPKAILVFTAFLPQFVDIARPMLPQFAVLGASFLVLECVAIALYSWAGMHLGKWLVRSRVRRWFNRCCGAFLAAIGVSFLLVRRA
ncbi:LysE family translocator [Paraburkholderia phenoliruptrix]|jgi:threonine/homoserine/homoserine lactone efflux protein|uniref:Homoserine/homoserine lactone efflux protein n=2 Tax=Paraburkholderia phenoliruptrix TaxID=252970 RepID=A0A6J5CH35_9BURK|nr:LysE family translocator [Paraburkholderia phenoliruptrix]AFT89198.1 lysine exporter protein LysE/YggA [Paraburkholderia phenoliruptrix BR3459a]MDR6422149.1 threonine/homoserine/homoserine lactone efflux protein [Paraburkholderia phenoliruptrix]WMY10671.1 LysE family translocator [Paraburkholderia phenoliruptrix]CAB3736870.1 Homoserine/homoserine lactone efflux protein [Paraburkholderia phenoliruptrix]CAB4050862.1 Homoserine/homoserine lactone efflux protein [Paraburkholderia phenoliruptrix